MRWQWRTPAENYLRACTHPLSVFCTPCSSRVLPSFPGTFQKLKQAVGLTSAVPGKDSFLTLRALENVPVFCSHDEPSFLLFKGFLSGIWRPLQQLQLRRPCIIKFTIYLCSKGFFCLWGILFCVINQDYRLILFPSIQISTVSCIIAIN
jgi:hypothetical protein